MTKVQDNPDAGVNRLLIGMIRSGQLSHRLAPDAEDYAAHVARLCGMADLPASPADEPKRGRLLITVHDDPPRKFDVFVEIGPRDAYVEMRVADAGAAGEPKGVAIPESMWRRIRPWREDFLCVFDVRLSDGRIVQRIAVRGDGAIVGRLEPGKLLMGDLGFTADDIAAVRRRSGGLLAPFGLSRWVVRT